MQRKIDTSQLWLVAIKDKELIDEPYIAFGVIEAPTADVVHTTKAVEETLQALRDAGRCRCVPCVIGPDSLPFMVDHFYRTSWVRWPFTAAQEIDRLSDEIIRLKAENERIRQEKRAIHSDDRWNIP